MKSNIAESMNSRNKKARSLPITALMEQLKALCQEWSVKFKDEGMNTFTQLTTKYHRIILKRTIKSRAYKVTIFFNMSVNEYVGFMSTQTFTQVHIFDCIVYLFIFIQVINN